MKKLFYMISVAAFMASFSSCGKIEQENTPVDNTPAEGLTTLAISATVPQTKTYLNNGLVKWVNGDFIQIFAEDGSYKFTDAVTYDDAAPETYDFTVADWPADKTPLCAIYAGQYAQQNSPATYVDGVFTATLPSSQKINNRKSFAKTANLSVGELVDMGSSYSVQMKNVCGLFKYTISTTGKVSSVRIEDVDGGAMSGKVNVTMKNGVPEAEVVEGKSSVTMEANVSGGNGLFTDDHYFACVLPGTYTLKVTVTFTDGTTNVLEANSPITVKRNEWIDLGIIDKAAGNDDSITITLNIADTPFNEELPGRNDNKKGPDTYTTKLGNYSFVICNTDGKYAKEGSYLRLTYTSGTIGYIQFPAIPDYKLVSVEVTGGNGTSSKKPFYLFAENPIDKGFTNHIVTTGNISTEDVKLLTVTDPIVNHGYYLASQTNNAQFPKLVLTYSK